MKRKNLAMDDSKEGYVCSSSNSSTISDLKIHQLNQSVYELHKPKGEPSMQVVFFHGFQYRNSDDVHLSTWKSGDGSHLWPQTWLVKQFPGANVFCVSYDARVEKGQGNFDLYIITENLTWDLVQANIGQVLHCPVILVGHCFGGLVIKQLCSHAVKTVGFKGESSDTGLKFSMFLQHVKGVFYYATPHHGISCNILPWFGHKSPLFQFVKKLSKHTARLNSEFNDLRHRNAWRVAGVGERLPTKWGLFQDDVVVPEASARDGVDSFNMVKADHFSISKPESTISMSFYTLTALIDSIPLNLKVNEPIHECEGLPDYPVDLDRQALDIKEKLEAKQVLGIFGMGGIGKTTLAKRLFNDISQKFEYTCFVDDAKGTKIHKLKDRLLGQFHRNGSKLKVDETEWSHLRGKKTLIVIDDVDSEDQLTILPKLHHFGRDSRVVITTRIQNVLKEVFEDYVLHDVEFLKEADAMTLFCKHAFRQGEIPSHLMGREQLVKDVKVMIKKCDGLPLTLEVIGRSLRDHENDANLWKETIDRLGEARAIDGNQRDRVWAKLKVSYDTLGSEEQQLFICAATIFFDCPLERALAAWSTTYRTPELAWANLVRRCLVKEVCQITEYDYYDFKFQSKAIWMHEHLRDLGKSLAPGNTISNEGDPRELSGLLNSNMVDEKTEFLKLFSGPWIWNSEYMTFKFRPGKNNEQMRFQFESLLNLKQLKYVELKSVGFIGSPKKLPRKISLLLWEGVDYTFSHTPRTYKESIQFPVSCIEKMENLAVLELRGWQTSQPFQKALGRLTNLRILELDSMHSLSGLPVDFGRLSHLKRLKFKNLELTELPESFGNLSSLVTAEFIHCEKLVTLPANFGKLSSLEALMLGTDDLDGSIMLKYLPDSFGQLKALRQLFMINVNALRSLPSNFCSLLSLQKLNIRAHHLEKLPENLGQLTSLQELTMWVHAVKALPESVGRLSSLRVLNFCSVVAQTLPDSLGQLDSLQRLEIWCPKIKNLPDSLGMLSRSSLRNLTIRCKELDFLPEGLGYLPSLRNLDILYCEKLKSLPDSLGRSSLLRTLKIGGMEWEFLPEWLGDLPSLEWLHISHCEKLKSLPDRDFPSLERLDISYCEKLQSLPNSLGRSSSQQETIDSQKCTTSSSSDGLQVTIRECLLLDESMLNNLGWVKRRHEIYYVRE